MAKQCMIERQKKRERLEQFDLSSLEIAVHAAAPCPVPVKEAMIEWWGPIIHEYYGATEGLGFTACNSEEWLAHKGTVGKVILGDPHIPAIALAWQQNLSGLLAEESYRRHGLKSGALYTAMRHLDAGRHIDGHDGHLIFGRVLNDVRDHAVDRTFQPRAHDAIYDDFGALKHGRHERLDGFVPTACHLLRFSL